jgi:hypothetical protein
LIIVHPKDFIMPSLPPELRVEIRKVGDQYLAVTERANGGEICSNTFTHDPDKLVHLEPQWMLERGARLPAEALKTDEATANHPPDDKLLIDYGQRLYGYLFGDGTALRNFFQFNDAYRSEARLTLRLHPEAAALEKYQQALSIFQQVGMRPDAERMQRHIARVRGRMGKT